MQCHLDCMTRQIAARAARQATTVKVRGRTGRRSGPRLYHLELSDRFTFERWAQRDAIAGKLAQQEQAIDGLGRRDHASAQYLAQKADQTPKRLAEVLPRSRCWRQ